MVELMTQLSLQKDDTVAVLVTGSMPGANIAVLTALKSLGVIPVTITSDLLKVLPGLLLPHLLQLRLLIILLPGHQFFQVVLVPARIVVTHLSFKQWKMSFPVQWRI